MQNILTPMAYVAAFLAVVLLVQALGSLFFSANDQNRRVNRRLTMLQAGMRPDEVYAALVRKPMSVGEGPFKALGDGVFFKLKQAGLAITPARLLMFVVVATALIWMLAMALLLSHGAADLLSTALTSLAGAAILAGLGAWVWIENRRKARLAKIEEQLPLALDIVTRALRAGHPVISAVQLAANELGDPIGTEFGLIVDETTYGLEFKEALVSLARRTGSADAHYFAVSVGIQSETGGNLAEILEGLSVVIRSRQTLAKRVRALSSEGRASAAILSVLPLLLVGLMMLFQPTFYTSKFSDPIFWPVISAVIVVYIIGQIMMSKIVDIKY